MRLSIFRVTICTLAAAAACSCQTVSLGEMAMLSPDYKDVRIDVLARDVEGEDCVSTMFNFDVVVPSFGEAIADALRKVPEANVMQDVSFELQTRFGSNCAWVKGNAGKFR
jgi:uncharacterized OsmC-like protein